MSSMLSLVDALPRHERVRIGNDQELFVYGLSGGDIGKILIRFPDAFVQIASSGSQPTAMDPVLLGALFAASQRNGSDDSLLGNTTAEQRARNLGVTDQVNIIHAIGRCTFPDGVGPFLEDLASMSESTAKATEVIVKVVSKGQPTASPPTPKLSEPPGAPASGS